jgi:hypothetical protein
MKIGSDTVKFFVFDKHDEDTSQHEDKDGSHEASHCTLGGALGGEKGRN